jgi:ADP-ribose pyrophosphatase
VNPRKTVRSEYVYRGKVVTLRLDTVEREDGTQTRREVVEHHGAVAIVPLLDESTVLLIRQYRQAVDEYLLEIPAGTLEDGENIEACAARELEEEIGYTAASLTRMLSQFLAPGYSNEVLHAFLGENLTQTQTLPDVDEDIEVVPVQLADIVPMILDGTIRDAKSIAALLVALRFKNRE